MKNFLFKIRQWMFVITLLSGNIFMYFLPMMLFIPILTSVALFIGLIINAFQESEMGRGLYLFNPPKKVLSVEGDYWIKLIKDDAEDNWGKKSEDSFFVVFSKRGWFFWRRLHYSKQKFEINGSDNHFNRKVDSAIDDYQWNIRKKKNEEYFTKGIFEEFKTWDGLVGSDSQKKALLRESRLDKLLKKRKNKSE